MNSIPLILLISAATFTSKPFLVFRPCVKTMRARPMTASWYKTYSADSGTTLSQKAESWEYILHTINTIRNLGYVAAKFLTQGQRSSILLESKIKIGYDSSNDGTLA